MNSILRNTRNYQRNNYQSCKHSLNVSLEIENIMNIKDDFDKVSEPDLIREGFYENENSKENPNFDYRDIDTLKNHWLKVKGKIYKGLKMGVCEVYLFNNEVFHCNFNYDMANGKGVFHN